VSIGGADGEKGSRGEAAGPQSSEPTWEAIAVIDSADEKKTTVYTNAQKEEKRSESKRSSTVGPDRACALSLEGNTFGKDGRINVGRQVRAKQVRGTKTRRGEIGM